MPDISLLPKEYAVEAAAPKGSRSLIIFSSLIFFGALFAWGGIYFYTAQLEKQINDANARVEEIKNTSLKDRQQRVEEIKSASEKLKNFKGVLDGHVYISNIFKTVEDLTLKTVYFNKFELDSKEATLSLSGVADTYDTFTKQFSYLKYQDKIIRKIDVESVSLTKEGVEFSFEASLNRNVLLKQQ